MKSTTIQSISRRVRENECVGRSGKRALFGCALPCRACKKLDDRAGVRKWVLGLRWELTQ